MSNWKQVFAPVLVFVLGLICGGAAMRYFAVREVREFVASEPDESSRLGTGFFARQLRLDAEQRAAAQPILDDLARGLARIRLAAMPETRELLNESAERLRPLLRPRQQRKLDEILARPRARWERLAPERRRFDAERSLERPGPSRPER